MVISNEDFIQEIEKFLEKTGMSCSAFGKKAKGDPCFYSRVKDGMEVKESGKKKVLDFMAKYESEHKEQTL